MTNQALIDLGKLLVAAGQLPRAPSARPCNPILRTLKLATRSLNEVAALPRTQPPEVDAALRAHVEASQPELYGKLLELLTGHIEQLRTAIVQGDVEAIRDLLDQCAFD